MIPSTSLFIMYLAVNKCLKNCLRFQCSSIWNFQKSIGDGIVCTLPSVVDPNLAPKNCESITMYFGMPFKTEYYWKQNKKRVEELFLQRFERVFPGTRQNIEFYETATPVDLYN